MIILINFARSGGTILNKCLASLPNNVVISEVSKYGGGWGIHREKSYSTVYEQALNWYGIELKERGFKESLLELDEFCKQNGKSLIVRDWSYINFFRNQTYKNHPSYLLETLDLFPNGQAKAFAFVRDGIDVWISRGMQTCDYFFHFYRKYVEELKKRDLKIYKYEDFVHAPQDFIRGLCQDLDLEYADIVDSSLQYSKVNGDTQLNGSRGQALKTIRPLPRKTIPISKIIEVNSCKEMHMANAALGYPTSYFNSLFHWKKLLIASRWGFRLIRDMLLSINKLNQAIINRINSKLFQIPRLSIDKIRVKTWFEADGDNTLRIDYPLNTESIVFDLGAYQGEWSSKIFNRYACNIYAFEPLKKFCKQVEQRFQMNPKIQVFNFGLGSLDEEIHISLDQDASSIFKASGEGEKITIVRASDFINQHKVSKIDLMKINIEGAEYDLLDHLIEEGLITQIQNIQVQFHDFVPDAEKRMEDIQALLSKTHRLSYQYQFVFENWELKTTDDNR